MSYFETLTTGLTEHWHVWLVTIVLIVAAVIDGYQLRVPNWLTFPMIISGWIFSATFFAMAEEIPWYTGLGWSLMGTVIGLALLLPLYSIGGMGAGDVKLLAGIGAWMHGWHTFYAFCITVIVGAVLAVAMVFVRRAWKKHANQFWMILNEIATVGDPNQLSSIAAERKSSMLLLPYGIPMAIGTIGYFAWIGLLI